VDLISANEYDNTLTLLVNKGSSFFCSQFHRQRRGLTNLTSMRPIKRHNPAGATAGRGADEQSNRPTLSGTFMGNGTNLTSLNANNLSGGTVPLAR